MFSNRIPLLRLSVFASLAALGLTSSVSFGQTQALAAPRVVSEVDPSQMVEVKGATLAVAQSRYDHGVVADATPTGRMIVVLKRSDAQQQSLKQLMASQQDPKSSSYHKWLTPESFGAQYGVADSDVQAVSSYLASQGFSVGRVQKSKMAIEFSGTTGQVRSAFKTEIHNYVVNGQSFNANATSPKIPAALAPVVSGFARMSNYKTPVANTSQPAVFDRKTGVARPLYSDGNKQIESVSPGDLAVIYDIPTSTYKGTGVTVGIVSDSNINLAIPANYRTTFGLTANPPSVIVDGNDPGIIADADLAYSQIELVAATAPSAKVNFYTSADTQLDIGIDFAVNRAVDDNAVQVLVFGFESCEANLGSSGNYFISSVWEQAAAQGISVIVGSGRGGAASCDAPTSGQTQSLETHGLAVNGYASTPYNTAVGATDIYYGPSGTVNSSNQNSYVGQYWNLNNGDSSYTSALSHFPEQPSNSSNQASNQESPTPTVVASGGGASSAGITNSDGSVTGYTKPDYQLNYGSSISSFRIVPDVSFFGADSKNNGTSYILCIDAADCVGGSPGTLKYTAGGDSRLSAAAFGGVAALIVQAKGTQGNLNVGLYGTYAKASSTAFHDITAGSNAVQCSGGADCAGFLTSYSGGQAYAAGTGFDAASGLGSVDVANLISNWTTPTGVATVTITLTDPGTTTPHATSIHHGDAVQLNVTVTGAGSTSPTGDVAISTNAPQAARAGLEYLTLTNGSAVDSAIGSLLPGGTYQLTARYAGDANYAAASASVGVTVSQVSSALSVLSTLDGTNYFPIYSGQTISYGSTVQISFQVYSTSDKNDRGSPTGSITVYDNGTKVGFVSLNSEGYATFKSGRLATGSHQITATYGGDATYGSTSLTGTAPSFTVSSIGTTTALTTTDSSIASRNGAFELVATVTPTGGQTGAAPGGTVQFKTSTGTLLGTANLGLGANSGTNPASIATFIVRRNTLSAGTISILATYVPDSSGTYSASTSSSVSVTVGSTTGVSNTGLTLTSSPANIVNILSNSSLTVKATVTLAKGAADATGNVTFYSDYAGGTNLGTVALTSNVATLAVPNDPSTHLLALPLGQSTITAQYAGDSTHAAAANMYTVNVYNEASTPDFTMQADPTYQPLSSSTTSADFNVQFGSLNNFAELGYAITLSYNTPTGFTCSSSPTAPSFSGDSASVTVTCTPASGYTLAKLDTPTPPHMLWMAEGGTALACIFLFGMPTRRRSWQSLLGALAVIAVAFGMTGCGATVASGKYSNYYNSIKAISGGATPKASGVITPGTYTVIVTGTSKVLTKGNSNVTVNATHNVSLKLVVS